MKNVSFLKRVSLVILMVILTVSVKDSSAETVSAKKVVVYYFHGNFRCYSCTQIERLTKKAIYTSFSDELASNKIEIRVINVEEPENGHYIKEYKLYTKSVVVSDELNGKERKWKNLPRVWELLRNEGAFIEYVRREIAAYIKN